jgi:hypothetical protein
MSTPIKPGTREFVATRDDKSLIKLSVRKPTRKELEYADLEYSAKFNTAIVNGIPTQAKLLRQLREAEVIDKKTEALLSQLATDLRAQEKAVAKLTNSKDEAAVKAAGDKLEELQKKLQELNGEVDSYFEHVAETKAQQAQRNFLVACVVETPDGDKRKRLWGGVEELLGEQDQSLINRTVYEYMMCQRDLPSEWDKLIAEQEAEAKKAKDEEEAAEKAANPAALDPTTSEVDAATQHEQPPVVQISEPPAQEPVAQAA